MLVATRAAQNALPILVLIVLSSLDRVNISFAALQMNAASGLTPETYGFAVGIFFFGYRRTAGDSASFAAPIWFVAATLGMGAVLLARLQRRLSLKS